MKATPKIKPSELPPVKRWNYPDRNELHRYFAGYIAQSDLQTNFSRSFKSISDTIKLKNGNEEGEED